MSVAASVAVFAFMLCHGAAWRMQLVDCFQATSIVCTPVSLNNHPECNLGFFSSVSSVRLWLFFFTPVVGFHISCNYYKIQT